MTVSDLQCNGNLGCKSVAPFSFQKTAHILYTFDQALDCDVNSQNWKHPVPPLPVQFNNIKYKV